MGYEPREHHSSHANFARTCSQHTDWWICQWVPHSREWGRRVPGPKSCRILRKLCGKVDRIWRHHCGRLLWSFPCAHCPLEKSFGARRIIMILIIAGHQMPTVRSMNVLMPNPEHRLQVELLDRELNVLR